MINWKVGLKVVNRKGDVLTVTSIDGEEGYCIKLSSGCRVNKDGFYFNIDNHDQEDIIHELIL